MESVIIFVINGTRGIGRMAMMGVRNRSIFNSAAVKKIYIESNLQLAEGNNDHCNEVSLMSLSVNNVVSGIGAVQ